MELTFLKGFHLWKWLTYLTIGLLLLVGFQLIPPLFAPTTLMWDLVMDYWMRDILIQTGLLLIFTGLISGILGVVSAYFMTFYQFKGRRFIELFLILPFGIPTYVMGYIYTTMNSVTGSMYQGLSFMFGSSFQGIQLYSLWGAVLLFSITLYPYVYLASRSFLMKQPSVMIEAARSLGASEFKIFRQILLPLLRPALIGATTLVVMEVLNDYGLVHYLGLRVYSTAIFQAWFNGNDLNTAVRLSSTLILVILGILTLETILRKHKKYGYISLQLKPLKRLDLSFKKKMIVYAWFTVLLSVAFFIPVGQLVVWFMQSSFNILSSSYVDAVMNTILISFYSMVSIIVLAVAIVNYNRYQPSMIKKIVTRFTNIGYSIPGTVIALALILFLLPIDRFFSQLFQRNQLWLTTSIFTLVLALIIRFLAVSSQLIESAYQKIGTKFTSASYAMGKGKLKTFFLIDLPLVNQGLIGASLIVLIDLLKELPLTLILRPFNVQTLATRLFQYANDEQIIASAPYALTLIVLTSGAVWFASDMILKVNRHES
jgi:iron(III) transport system permease protein